MGNYYVCLQSGTLRNSIVLMTGVDLLLKLRLINSCAPFNGFNIAVALELIPFVMVVIIGFSELFKGVAVAKDSEVATGGVWTGNAFLVSSEGIIG